MDQSLSDQLLFLVGLVDAALVSDFGTYHLKHVLVRIDIGLFFFIQLPLSCLLDFNI